MKILIVVSGRRLFPKRLQSLMDGFEAEVELPCSA